MKAAYLTKHAGPEELVLGELPQPCPGRDEVLVRVRATAVTPTEFNWFPTFKTRSGEPRPFPIVLSHEFAGVVEQVGDAVNGLKVGDAVYGMNDWFANGAQAEFCVAPANSVAAAPRTLEQSRAAVVPISALTAWQGLFERCRLRAGERVLIHGGAGGVGVFAVQLAHWRGAHVIATASNRNLDFVRSLGADEVVDYQTTPFENAARDMDVVFDTVGGETLDRSWSVLRSAGRLVTIAAQSEARKEPHVREAFFIVEPNPGQLAEICRLLDSGTLRAFVEAVFRLNQACEAYARATRGGMRGKVALQVTNER
jgi:NADPH:quinone reductase-like Zn-dependent oxidoreductase